MSKLTDALRLKYKSPAAAVRALGLSPDLINGPRLAADEDNRSMRALLRAVEKKTAPTRNKPAQSYSERWPTASRIRGV